jgi:putative oxidoreductase
MNIAQRFETWGDTHHPKWLDIIRITLGLFLCYKGFAYLQNMSALIDLMTFKSPFSSFIIIMLGHYVAFAHLVGGILLTLGVFTRFACLIQIPILIGAVVFINSGTNMFGSYSELFFSILVLLLLVYFLIVGNGPWSIKLGSGERKAQ